MTVTATETDWLSPEMQIAAVAARQILKVLAGLDQLEAQVTAAGSIETFVRGEAPGAMRAHILWDGENLSVTPSIVSELILSGPGITTEVRTIQLAEWWEREPESLTASCDPIRWTDPESVQEVRELWLNCLYPNGENFGQEAASLISNGQMPINIELEAVGLTPRALAALQFTSRHDEDKEIATTIVDYYLIKKKAPWPAPDAEMEGLITGWVLKDDTKLQTAYLAAKEVTA